MSKSLKIFLLFFSLNFLLFFPRYIVELNESTFFPWKGFLEEGFYYKIKYLFFNRDNFDIFRIASDYLIWFMISYAILRYNRFRFWVYLFPGFYLIILLYQIYFALFEGIFKTPPLFFNDIHSIHTGWQILRDSLGFWFTKIILGFVVLFILCWWLNYRLVSWMQNWKPALWLQIVSALMLIHVLVSFYRFRFDSDSSRVVQIPLASLVRNIAESDRAAGHLKNFDMGALMEANPYGDHQLSINPNLWLIFIESYGRIVLDDKNIAPGFIATVRQMSDSLDKHQWHAVSHLSRSPVTGGISWIAYSSFLYGFNFLDHGTYLALMADSSLDRYPHFLRYLKNQGYKNYRLSAIAKNDKLTIPWEDYTRFYSTDQWILFPEMGYTGKMYGFGPSPPDQFALYYANELIRSDSSGPFSLFFITQNSHSPFYAPKHPVPDWTMLDDGSLDPEQRSRFMDPPRMDNYISAIQYEIEFLVDFIIKSGTPEDLFLLIGDHQPPFLTDEEDPFETPVHIISKDSLFINDLKDFGFQKGMLPDTNNETLRHEGLFSLLMHVLLKSYGEGSEPIPPYRPDGLIQLDR